MLSSLPASSTAVFATGQSVRPGLGRGRTTLCRPPPSPTVPRRPLSSPAAPRCFPPSPAVLCSYLPSPARSCPRSWGSSPLLMTAVRGIQGRGRTAFCRPVSSGGLSSPPTGPYGGPGRLTTLLHSLTAPREFPPIFYEFLSFFLH